MLGGPSVDTIRFSEMFEGKKGGWWEMVVHNNTTYIFFTQPPFFMVHRLWIGGLDRHSLGGSELIRASFLIIERFERASFI